MAWRGRGRSYGKGKGYRGGGKGKGRGRGRGRGRGGAKTWTRDKAASSKRDSLPVMQFKQQIVDLVEANRAIVITGEAGCGKSTQVPQYIIDAVRPDGAREPRVLVTQPRRVAAVSVARRVAAERGEAVGQSVGYHVAGDQRGAKVEEKVQEDKEDTDMKDEEDLEAVPAAPESVTKPAKCVYMTTGVLLQLLTHHRDDTAGNYSHILIDEAHERDVDMDLVLVTLRRMVIEGRTSEKRVPKVIIMSATVDAQRLCGFFGDRTPHLHVGTRPFPVRVHDLDQVIEASQATDTKIEPWSEYVPKDTQNARFERDASRACVQVLKALMDPVFEKGLLPPIEDADSRRDVLVFAPGVAEIEELENLCRKEGVHKLYDVLPLHGALDDKQQRHALSNPEHTEKRRCVLTTNVAESSVTVPGVRFVIDFGLEKLPVYDPRTKTQALLTRHCSRASCAQRAGRCGRVAPGACLRLYSQKIYTSMPAYIPPEIVRAPLPTVALKALLLDDQPAQLLSEALDAPQKRDVEEALTSLVKIGAIRKGDPEFEVEPLGELVSRLDVDANVGRLVAFGAALGCLDDMCVVAAAVSLRDVFLQPFEAGKKKAEEDVDGDPLALTLEQGRQEVAHFLPRRRITEQQQFSDALATVAILREFKRRLSTQSRDEAARYARQNHASFKRLVEVDALAKRLGDTYDRLISRRRKRDRGALQRLRRARNGLQHVLKKQPALITTAKKFALLCCFSPTVAVSDGCETSTEQRGTLRFRVEPARPRASFINDAKKARAAFDKCGAISARLYRQGEEEVVADTDAPPPPPQETVPLDIDGLSGDEDAAQKARDAEFDNVYDGLDEKGDAMDTDEVPVFLELTTRSGQDAVACARMAGVRGSLRLPLGSDGTLHLRDPQLKMATLQFRRPGAGAHIEPTWSSPNARFFVDPYGSAATRRRWLVAPCFSSRGASKTRQLAHSPTLLPAEPRGAAELLLLACSRDVRWLLDDDRVVAAELFGVQPPDSLIVPLVTHIDAKDVRLLNKLREALSKSVRDPDGAPGAAVQPLVDLLDRADREPFAGLDSFAEAQLLPGVDDEEALLAPLSRVGLAALDDDEEADAGKRGREEEDAPEDAPAHDLKRARLADY